MAKRERKPENIQLGKRIKTARGLKGLSQDALAQICGVTTITVSRWETGVQAPDDTTKKQIAQALDTTIAFLMSESDTPSQKTDADAIEVIHQNHSRVSNGNMKFPRRTVPVAVVSKITSICAGGGFGLMDVKWEVDYYREVEESFILGPTGPKELFIVQVEGESMEPEIMDGEYILCNPNETVTSGDVAVVCWNGRWSVKGVEFKDCEKVILKPVNPDYRIEEIAWESYQSDELLIAARVVAYLGVTRKARKIP